MSEADALKRAMLELSGDGFTVFRNHVGTGVFGSMRRIPGSGDAVVVNARIAQCGLHEGSADLIGWRTVTVGLDMVGRRLAVFASIEVKSASGRLRENQRTWARNVHQAGGIALVYRENAGLSNVTP